MYLIVINSVISLQILSDKKFKTFIFLQPKSESSDKSCETGSQRQRRSKKVDAVKNLLRRKLPGTKKSKPVSSDLEEDFHGFTDSEIETASLKSDRSIVGDLKHSKKPKQKKLLTAPKSHKKSVSDDVSVDLEEINEKNLIVSGKRKWKPTLKVQENSKKKEKTKTARKASGGPETTDLHTSVKVSVVRRCLCDQN